MEKAKNKKKKEKRKSINTLSYKRDLLSMYNRWFKVIKAQAS